MSLARAITITRPATDPYSKSYDVWVKLGVKPLCAGDGLYAGNAEMETGGTSVIFQWTAPTDNDWLAIAIPLRDDVTGRAGGLAL